MCGYAGGLSPENVVAQLEKIAVVSGDVPIWIDAETNLRSDQGQHFDLDRVCAFAEAVKPWIRYRPERAQC
jgi:phosphoribosylanthranilate isomerase